MRSGESTIEQRPDPSTTTVTFMFSVRCYSQIKPCWKLYCQFGLFSVVLLLFVNFVLGMLLHLCLFCFSYNEDEPGM